MRGLSRAVLSLWAYGEVMSAPDVIFPMGSFMSFFSNNFDADQHVTNSVKPEELKKTILKEPYVGVMFYAPWCFYCQQLHPQWDEAERKLKLHKPNPIPMIRHDSSSYTMTSKYAKSIGIEPVDRYPTIYFFVDGTPFLYEEEDRSWQSIVKWANKLADRQHVLTSVKDMEGFFHDSTSAVIGLFNDPTMHDTVFKKAALDFPDADVLFASSISPTVSKELAEHLKFHHIHRCQTIHVGDNKKGLKSVEVDNLPFEHMECGHLPMNPQNPKWMDLFSPVVEGKRLSVQRTDQLGGPWLQELKLKCCVHTDHDEKNDPIDVPVPGLVMFTDHPEEPFTVYAGDASKLTTAQIIEFADERSLPPVTILNDDVSGKIFSAKRPILYVSVKSNPNSKEAKAVEEALREAARTSKVMRKKMVAVLAKEDSLVSQRLDKTLNVPEDEIFVRIMVPPGGNRNNDPKKFKLKGVITAQSISTFTQNFVDGKIYEYVKSEPIIEPEYMDPDDAVILVGDNFKQTVLDKEKDVFVDLFAPWCGHCIKLNPIWKNLYQELRHVPTLTIAKMSMTENEQDLYPIQGYPTILLFRAGAKSRPLEYNGERTVNGFVHFLLRNCKIPFDRNKPTTPKPKKGVPQEPDNGSDPYFEHSVDL